MQPTAKQVAKRPAKPIVKQPQFDFYTILPKTKVWVPKPEKATAPLPKQPPAPTAYMVQVASFKAFKDADKLKAQLILQGYNVSIRPREQKGIRWNRVWVGPFPTKSRGRKVQRQLAKQHLKSL